MSRLLIGCVSDTHNRLRYINLPPCDVLLHAGDHTMGGKLDEIQQAAKWMKDQDAKLKIAIAGNHDWLCQKDPERARKEFESRGIVYLQDEPYTIKAADFGLDRDLTVWGSPWQPEFYNWAFNLKRGAQIREKWDLIPAGTDILITHGPVKKILDRAPRDGGAVEHGYGEYGSDASDFTYYYEHVGCDDLLEAVKRVKPGLHVFGHIHVDRGVKNQDGTVFVNAASVNEQYRPEGAIIYVEYENGKFKAEDTPEKGIESFRQRPMLW